MSQTEGGPQPSFPPEGGESSGSQRIIPAKPYDPRLPPGLGSWRKPISEGAESGMPDKKVEGVESAGDQHDEVKSGGVYYRVGRNVIRLYPDQIYRRLAEMSRNPAPKGGGAFSPGVGFHDFLGKVGEEAQEIAKPSIAPTTFSAKVREYRERLGLSQRGLSGKAGLNHGYINRLERHSNISPKAGSVLRIIDGLGFRYHSVEARELVQLTRYDLLILDTGSSLTSIAPDFFPTKPRLPNWTPWV